MLCIKIGLGYKDKGWIPFSEQTKAGERKKYAASLLIKHKYKVAKTAKVLFLFLFFRKYTFSTPDKKKNP